ncbi:MAG: gliding motility-associated C-terminal domain-containing protein [Crocinitomicaceae bacterium]|nr:gliding motility-associated C-terminal domain-containing protein [Crocinitomicaceae bacterium]
MRYLAFVGLLLALVFNSRAQYCTTATSTTAISPSSTTQTTATFPAGTAPVFTFTGNAGCTYTFTTCGLSSVDTYLRIYNSSVALVQGWDDQCGLQTNAVWTCPVTGSYSIQLSQFVCSPLAGSASMSYSVSCPTPPCSNPVVNAGPDIIICAGASGQLSGSATAGTGGGTGSSGGTMVVTISGAGWLDMVSWTLTNAGGTQVGSGGPYALGSTNTITVATPGTGPYSFYLETLGAICDNTANYNITCNGTSVASGSVGPCNSTTISVANCSTTGGPSTLPLTYTWSPATALSSTTILNPTASPTTTTTYTLTATQGTCSSQDQVTVYVNPLPTVDAGPDVTLCGGQTSTVLNGTASASGGFTGDITVNLFSGSNLDETTWTMTNSLGTVLASGGPYAAGSNNTITISNPSNPPYTFNLETQGPSNSNVAGYNILCGGLTGTSISGGLAILTGGQSIAVPIAGCAGTVTPSVTWSPVATLSSTNTLSTTASPTTTTTYTLTATANGCTNQDQVTVTIGTPPGVSVNSPSICAGQTTTLTASPATPGGTYLWSPGGQTTSSIDVSPTTNSTYSVVYTLNGCASLSTSSTVTVSPSPTVSIAPVTFCPGAAVTLTANPSTTGGTYTWNPGGQTTSSITVSPTSTTNYSVDYALLGCPTVTATGTATIANIVDWANIQWPGTSNICEGESLSIYGQVYEAGLTNLAGQAAGISVSYAISSTNTNPATWPTSSWSSATYNPLSSVNPNNDEYSATLTGLSAGTYYYAFSYTYNGCTVYGGFNPNGGGFWDGSSNVNGVVTVTANTAPSFSPVAAICFGSSLTALPTVSNNGISGSWTPALNNTQTTSYTFTPTSGTCATTANLTITVDALPTAGITNNTNTPELNCTTTSISLTGTGGTSYSWNDGSAVISTNASLSVTSPGLYEVTVTNAAGCQDALAIQISQDTISPIISISIATNELNCNTTSINLNANGATTYTWYNGASAIGAGASLVVNAPGTYTVIGAEPNGCTATSSETITQNIVLPALTLSNLSGTTTLNCSTTTIDLSATGGSTYSWSNGTSIVSTNATYSATTPGTYTVTTTGANGCSANASITITQDITAPSIALSTTNGSILNCSITTTTLSATGANSYSWSNGSSIVGSTASINVTTPGTYTVTATGANGCTSTASQVVTQDLSAPTAAISSSVANNTLTCATTSISLTASGNGTYSWTQGATNLGNTATLNVTNTGTYILTVTGSNGCTATASTIITQDTQAPTAAISASPQTNILTCSTTSIALTASGGVSYAWSNGTTNIGSTASINVSTPGIYTVTVTGANGCTASANSNITQDIIAPIASIDNPTNTTTLNCTTTSISLNATGGASYEWSNGTIVVGTNAALSVSSPGTYTVTVTGPNGCTATASTTITQTTAAPVVAITNAPNASELTCSLTSIGLTASGGGTYSWSNGTAILGTTASLNVTTPGTYTVTVTGANGCSTTSSTVITQNLTAPTAAIASNPNTTMLSCTNNALSLTATGGTSYSWSNGTTTIGTSATISIANPGTYTVTVTSANGCTATAATTITQNNQAPTVSIAATANGVLTCSTTSITLTGSSSTGSGTATWLNGSTVLSTGPISGAGNVSNYSVSTPGTYTLNILEANGCLGTTNYVVTQNIAVPVASIVSLANTTILDCNVTAITLAASGGVNASWSNGTGTISINNNISVTTPGTYTATVTGSNGCIDTEQITITQNITAPTAAVTNNTAATQLTCSLTSMSLTATGGGTYSWSNGTSVVGTTANLTVTTPGTYTVTVTSSTNGCTATNATIITQNITPPTAAISSVPNPAVLTCTTTSIALTASGGGSYSWIAAGTNLGTQANISVTTPGTYTVTVTAPNGCSSTASTTITQNTTAPSVNITNLPNVNILNCTTTSINLTATGGTAYSWSNGTAVVGTAATLAVSSPGTYTVTVTAANGCTATANSIITQDISAPTATITNNSNTNLLTCSQTSISLTASGGVSYSWSNATSVVGTAAALSVTAPGTYTVTATAANGCTDTEQIVITQDVLVPTAAIANAGTTTVLDCNITSISLTANGGVAYSWSNGTSVVGTTAPLSVSTAGTYTVTVTAANGCTDTEALTITFQANTNPTFTQIAPICTGGVINLATTSNNGVNGSWSPAPNANATTTYTFTPNTGLCANTATMTIVVNPYPSITAQNDTICTGANGTITTQISLIGGTYTWNNSTNTQANLLAAPNATSTYTVIYNLAGCTDTASAQIVVNPVPVVQVQNATICAGQAGALIASANLANGAYLWANGTTNDTLVLSPNSTTSQAVTYTLNGCTSIPVTATLTVNPVPTITMNNQTICAGDPVTMQANANPAGTYYWGPNGVQGIATNTFTPTQDSTIEVFNVLNGCSSDTIQANITVLPLPISTFNANILQGCVPLSVDFSADVLNNTTYTWQTSNQLTASGAQTTLDFQSNGSFSVTLTATLNGCSSSTTIANMIEVDNYPIAAFEPSSQVFTEPNQALSFWNSSVGATSYQWNFGEGGSSSEEAPTHIFNIDNEGTTVLLYAYSNLGCSDTASFYIGFDPGLVYYIPNSFTPDADQFNQTFLPIFTSGIDPYNYQLLIYNRWGEVIFESLNPAFGWDGSFGLQGNPCPVGTYTYMITVKLPSVDKRQTIKGHINLIR